MSKLFQTGIAILAFTLSQPLLADQHDSAGFKVTTINPQLLLLQGKGGNIALSKGDDGLLIIDNDYPDMAPALKAEIEKIGGKLKFILNTHWHGDHAGGNDALGKIEGVNIVAHENVRKRLSSRQEIPLFKMVSEPQPKHALPTLTYPQAMTIHFNGDTLNLVHYPNGHTDTDTVIYFDKANVVHMGDHLFYPMFPFVDIDSGGNVVSYTQNVAAILEAIDEKTVVIPGHGPLTDKKGLTAYHKMLQGTTAEVKTKKDKGLSLEQIQAEGLSKQWDDWTKGFIKSPVWISFIYNSL